MIAFILLKLLLFSAILFIFGWQLTRFVLKEKRIEALIPLSVAVGTGLYIFLLNALSYFIRIQINFYLILILFSAISLILFFFDKKEKPAWGINKRWRKIILATALLITAIFGIFAVRHLEGDELSFPYLPLAATIAEGNFPVKDLIAPPLLIQYHYAPQLLMAAIAKTTNLPLWFASDFQPIVFLGILFLMGFLLINDFCRNNFKAYFASLLSLFGGGLSIIYGIKGIPVLYSKYILHQPIDAPFKFADYMVFGKGWSGRPLLINFEHAWVPLAFILIITVIYLYFRAGHDKNWFRITLLNIALLSLLALANETFFVILVSALMGYPFILLAAKRNWRTTRPFLIISFLLVLVSVLAASAQGGIFSEFIKEKFSEYSGLADFHKISITFDYIINGELLLAMDHAVKIFSLDFLLGWGLLLILIIPASVCFLKKSFQLGLFLILISFISFIPAFFIDAGAWQGDVLRIFYIVTPFWALIVGFFLAGKYPKLLITIPAAFIASQGLLFALVSPIFPGFDSDPSSSFWGALPKPSGLEQRAISWIRENTAINDYFLTFEGDSEFVNYNHKFIIRAGRLSPVFFYGSKLKIFPNYSDSFPEAILYKRVIKECDASAIRTLNYRYLYVNEHWPQGLEEKCLNQAGLDLRLKFSETGSDEIARIYLIK